MADQSFTITSTYDPSTNSIACNPSSIRVGKSDTGKILVNLELATGSTGTITFQADPVQWSTTPPVSFNVQSKSSTQIQITAPNGNSSRHEESFSFLVNYTYTPVSGDPVSQTGDPTIILEGTGSVWSKGN